MIDDDNAGNSRWRRARATTGDEWTDGRPSTGPIGRRADLALIRHPAALSAMFLAAFIALAIAVAGDPPGWDRRIFVLLYSDTAPWIPGTPPNDNALLHALLPLCHRVSDLRVIAGGAGAVLVVLLARSDRRQAGFFVSSLLVLALADPLKAILDRPSPFASGPAFPSGHALAAMTIAAAAAHTLAPTVLRWPARVCGLFLVCAVAVSVIADGGHWPSDVLGAWLLALSWVFLARAAWRA